MIDVKIKLNKVYPLNRGRGLKSLRPISPEPQPPSARACAKLGFFKTNGIKEVKRI